jgi:hypothetical protein
MNTSTFYGPNVTATDPPATRGNTGQAIDRLLLGLWVTTAIGLVVLPFLKQYRVVSLYGDQAGHEGMPDIEHEYSADGWGRLDELSGHGPRFGILFLAVAALLILAVVATIASRRSTWPVWVGLSASTMAVTASVVQLLELEAVLLNEDVGDASVLVDVTVSPAAWLALAIGALASVAVAVSLVELRRRRGTSRHPVPEAPGIGRPPFALMALWIAAAVSLVVAPFLTLLQVGNPDRADSFVQIDGWDRAERSVGIPCTVLAIGLVVSAIAVAVWRAKAWPLRIGLLAGIGSTTVAGFLWIRLEPALNFEDSEITVSIGVGGWLILAAGVPAAVAVGLTLVRQWRLRLN